MVLIYQKKRERIPYWVDRGGQIWEELWEGGEYNQNLCNNSQRTNKMLKLISQVF